jgi:hypothetical protein
LIRFFRRARLNEGNGRNAASGARAGLGLRWKISRAPHPYWDKKFWPDGDLARMMLNNPKLGAHGRDEPDPA